MLAGEHAIELSIAGADSVKEKLLDTPLAVAVTAAVSLAATEATFTVNVAVLAPAATVTLAGTVALALELLSVVTTPPAGAAADSVTVHVAVPGVFTVAGVQLSVLTAGRGVTVTVVAFAVPPVAGGVAVTVTV
jgi:hypothetical protein